MSDIDSNNISDLPIQYSNSNPQMNIPIVTENTKHLPNNHYPNNIDHIILDNDAIINNIPNNNNNNNNDYEIPDFSTNNNNNNNTFNYDTLYEQLKYPIIVTFLYFFFHLPAINNIFYNYLPFCYDKTKSINTIGRFIKAFSFGLLIAIIIYTVNILT